MSTSNYVVKPGPSAGQGWTLAIPSTGGGGGQAGQIISLASAGSSGAMATIRLLDASGFLSSDQYASVYIIPYPEFAEVGDRGVVVTYTPTSGLTTSNIRYIHIAKEAFLTY